VTGTHALAALLLAVASACGGGGSGDGDGTEASASTLAGTAVTALPANSDLVVDSTGIIAHRFDNAVTESMLTAAVEDVLA
jgi:hypothetical protein